MRDERFVAQIGNFTFFLAARPGLATGINSSCITGSASASSLPANEIRRVHDARGYRDQLH
jgi:hypothetical protein